MYRHAKGSLPEGAGKTVRFWLREFVPNPSREKVNRENPQIFPIYKLQIIFPLNMRRATRRAFKSFYTAPKIVALYGARGALPVKMRLGPRHRLEEVPSLSSFHCPAGRETVQAVSVGL